MLTIHRMILGAFNCSKLCTFKTIPSYLYILNISYLEVPSQNCPVQLSSHPLSNPPVNLLQGAASLHLPGHLTHIPLEMYVPSLHTEIVENNCCLRHNWFYFALQCNTKYMYIVYLSFLTYKAMSKR